MSTTEELACVYSALVLADDDIPITAEKITTILKAAKISVEPIWPSLFAKALTGVDIKELVTNIGSAAPAAGAPAAGGAAAAAGDAPAEEKKEEKKEESEEESDDDMGFGLFD